MMKRIKALMLGGEGPAADDVAGDGVQAAAAALLIEAAFMDGEFDSQEHETITRLLSERFDLNGGEVAELIEVGRQTVDRSVELFTFTRVLKNSHDDAERIDLIEMLWEVVYADGELHDYEANLVRRVAGLLHVPDQQSGAARKRVLERLDIDGLRL